MITYRTPAFGLFLILVSILSVHAQTGSGTLSGDVKIRWRISATKMFSQDGKVVEDTPGEEVNIEFAGPRKEEYAVTDGNGVFSRVKLAAGTWTLQALPPPPGGSTEVTPIQARVIQDKDRTVQIRLIRPYTERAAAKKQKIELIFYQLASFTEATDATQQTQEPEKVSQTAAANSLTVPRKVVDASKRPVKGAVLRLLVMKTEDNSYLLRADDFTTLSALIVKLRDPQNSLSRYLRVHFTPPLQSLLDAYDVSKPPPAPLQTILTRELNELLSGTSLFEEQLFAGITLRAETQRLLGKSQPEDLLRLNRLLLEDAYPNEITKRLRSPLRFSLLQRTESNEQGVYELEIPDGPKSAKYILIVNHANYYPNTIPLTGSGKVPEEVILNAITVAEESEEVSLVSFEPARRTVFLPQLMQTLPIPGPRSFDYLAQLAPGVLPPPETVGTAGPGLAPGIGTAGQFAINGLRSRENNFTVDGSDNNDEDVGTRRQGFVLLTPQSIESLQEFQVITALADARFGRNLGGQVNALTQSGSLGLHGQVFGFFTNDRLNAREFFDQTTDGAPASFTLRRSVDGAPIVLDGQPLVVSNPVGGKDKLTRTQGGVVIGGRLTPIDTFFFGSFDRVVARATRESHFAVPTVAQRGIFGTGETGSTTSIFTYLPASMPGNALFSLYPFPNDPRGPYGANTYTAVLPADADGTRFSGKLTKQFGKSNPDRKFRRRNFFWAAGGDTLTGRYNFTQDKGVLPVVDGALYSTVLPRVRTQNIAFFFDRTLGKDLTDTIRFSLGRTRLTFSEVRDPYLSPSKFFPDTPFLLNAPLLLNLTRPNQPLNPTSYVSASSPLGTAVVNLLGYGSVTTAEEITGPLGHVVIPGFSSLGLDVNYFPQSRANNTFQIADTIAYVRSKRVYTFGFDIRKTQINSTQDRGFRPEAVFNGLRISDPHTSIRLPLVFTGSTLAAMGTPTGLFQTLAAVPDSSIGLRFTQLNLFAQEERRIRPHLSLTLGIRYELNTVPDTVGGRLERAFDPADLKAKVNAALPQCIANLGAQLCNDTAATILSGFPADYRVSFGADKNDVDLRVGFAWKPSEKADAVLRAGFGIYSGQVNGLVLSQSRNAFPDFLPLNFANFPQRIFIGGPGLNTSTTYLFNPANPVLRQLPTGTNGFNLIRPGTLNTVANGDTIGFLLNGLPLEGSLDLVLPQKALKGPYSFQYGVTLERTFRNDYLLAVAYVGSRGTKLLRVTTPQQGFNLSGILAFVSPQSAQFPFPSFGGFLSSPPAQTPPVKSYVEIVRSLFESSAESSYNSLQVELRKRFSRHFQFGTALTYSHSIDDASDYLDTAGAFALPQNSLAQSERGSSSFDIRLRSVTNLIVDLPWKWQASGILMAQTGQPFTVNTIFDINRDGNLTDRLTNTNGLVTNPTDDDRSIRLSLTPGTNPISLLALDGQDGAVGRNTFRTRGSTTFDASFARDFMVGFGKFQFRTEIFNLFNRSNFAIPVRILESPAFGKSVRTTNPARMVQFGFKVSF